MPHLITVTLTAHPGRVHLSVRRWALPESPYPVRMLDMSVPVEGKWGSTADTLDRIADVLKVAADQERASG